MLDSKINGAAGEIEEDKDEAQEITNSLEHMETRMDRLDSTVSDSMINYVYVSYPYRWLLLFSFCIALMSTGIIHIGFSSIAHVVSDIYDC